MKRKLSQLKRRLQQPATAEELFLTLLTLIGGYAAALYPYLGGKF